MGADKKGSYAFRNQNGDAYLGNNQFINDVATGLNSLMNGGEAGNALVAGLAAAQDNVQILQFNSGNSEFATNTPSQFDSYVRWNPNNNGVAGNQRPAFVGLGHELAHTRDRFNSTLDSNPWFGYQDAQGNAQYIPRYEISATHLENQVRSENNLPLRPSYIFDQNGNPTGQRIIFNGTRQSRYYDSGGNLNPNFRPIRRKTQTPFTY